MSKKEICLNNESFAYYSGLGGLELKKIEYGIEDYVYCVSGAWTSKKAFHRLKVYYNDNGGYIKLHGYKIHFSECVRMGDF